MACLAAHYTLGTNNLPVDIPKANDLYRCASDLGSAAAHYNLGNIYASGRGVNQDSKKAIHHWQIAAMMGHEFARYNLGCEEGNHGNFNRAMKHFFMISAKCGLNMPLQKVKEGFMLGLVTKEDFEKTLRTHKDSQDEMKSEQREEAKAVHNVSAI
eukprot:scaffold35397_cov34-Cyclotella_meneghiniana.AAC.5